MNFILFHKIKNIQLIAAVCFVAFYTSCIRDYSQECSYKHTVLLYVKDKCYFNEVCIYDNINDISYFNKYINNVYYTLRNLYTNDIVISQYMEIANEEAELLLVFNSLQEGDYILTVWGNVDRSMDLTMLSYPLHTDKSEDADVYMASGILHVAPDLVGQTELGLERMKGKLITTFNKLPENIYKIEESVSFIYEHVNNRQLYSEETMVEKVFLNTIQPLTHLSTYLAPTVEGEESLLIFSLYLVGDEFPIMITPSLNINIKRNEITELAIIYNDEQLQWEVWIYIDNKWSLIHYFII